MGALGSAVNGGLIQPEVGESIKTTTRDQAPRVGGDSWRPITGHDDDGNPIFGDPVAPTFTAWGAPTQETIDSGRGATWGANLTQGTQYADYLKGISQGQVNDAESRAQAQQLIGQLQDQSAGKGPSLAQLQLQQATQQNNAQAAGAVASQKGINPALAARMILQNQAASNQQAAGQSAMTRMQEQMGARSMLGAALSSQRALDVQGMTAAGQLNQQQNQARIQDWQQTQALNQKVQSDQAQLEAGEQNRDLRAAEGAAQYKSKAGDSINRAFDAATGGASDMMKLFGSDGGEVPGTARVPGDDPSNDTAPAVLSPGEIVLPRSVAQAEDAPERAAKFVEAIRRHNGGGDGYANLLAKRRELSEQLERVNTIIGKGKR